MEPEFNPTKTCKSCGEEKLVSSFYLDRGKPRSECKTCASAKQKAWRGKNEDRNRIVHRAYYLANRESMATKSAEWAKANPEKVKQIKRQWEERHREANFERKAQWRKDNPEKMDECRARWREANPNYSKEWAARNPTKINAYSHNRRAKYVGRYTDDDVFELWSKQKGKCEACKVSLKKSGHHVDHIMPVKLGGTNWPDNLQLLCPPCNINKAAKDPIKWANENGRLF